MTLGLLFAWATAHAAGAAPLAHPSADAFRAWLATHHAATVKAARWRSPTEAERIAWSQALPGVVAAAPTCAPGLLDALAAPLAAAGYALGHHTWPGGAALVLTETSPHGAGLLVLRCGDLPELVVQAPHGLYDLDTDTIAFAAVALGEVRGGMWNTVHRYRATPDERPEDRVHPADVCHQATSTFQTATLAWALAEPEVRFVQLHGFDARRNDAAAVLSTGRPDRPPKALREPLAVALALAPTDVEVYGVDASDLGGTRNVQALALASSAAPRFLHVELARGLRERLAKDADLAVAVVRTITTTSWAP